MKKETIIYILIALLFSGIVSIQTAQCQMITGVWKGKINRQKTEIKIIQNRDSLTGTSYYFENADNYRRYSIKGYFDAITNEAIWWDDKLLEEKSSRFNISIPGKVPLLSTADFNCPGGSKMMLDGKSAKKENDKDIKGEVHLNKIYETEFPDEWDYVIDNYTVGTNDPEIIDSIETLAQIPQPIIEEPAKNNVDENQMVITPAEKVKNEPIVQKQIPVVEKPMIAEKSSEPKKPLSIEDKFTVRKKVFIKEIPVSGDSIELRFYDNAEIDGDSISLFLNDKLIFQHIKLTANAFSIKIPVKELQQTNELIMVAENMGTIPPNTSYMVAIINNERYEAYLASTEGSSAMIRFVKQSH